MAQKADVLVSNGDLVSTGSVANYTAYLDALAAGGGGEYETVISTIGNHEYYGSEGSAVYQKRFLDMTGMREVGGEGGLWGEVLVDGELPLLWFGSEFYDYTAQTGSGPFMELGREQFSWLRDRLAYWREQGKPVLLFSHHLLPYSVSGSYARFYENDFGQDEERFAALLDQNPNVILFNSHTHWSPTLNDWSFEMRTDPTLALAPTAVNTAAVTTMYGPSGDWEERVIGGADPVGLRAALYDDRVRVTAYSFSPTGSTEVKHIDVPGRPPPRCCRSRPGSSWARQASPPAAASRSRVRGSRRAPSSRSNCVPHRCAWARPRRTTRVPSEPRSRFRRTPRPARTPSS